jgi:hypothetical protein
VAGTFERTEVVDQQRYGTIRNQGIHSMKFPSGSHRQKLAVIKHVRMA